MNINLELTDQNYCATVVKIESTVKLEGLDNLVGVPIFGFNALISKDSDLNKLYILFTAESQLSEDFCKNNNLYDHPELNLDQTKKGYINSKRRIRAVRLRGHISSAFLIGIDSLNYLNINIDELKEGDTFNSINRTEVVKKYIIRNTQPSSNKKPRNRTFKIRHLLDSKLIPEHVYTSHWGRCSKMVDGKTNIVISQKLHGCVRGDTIIQTLEFGPLPIKEIVEKRISCKVLSRDINNNEDVFVDIDDYFFKENDGDWYEIELENGSKITITGCNPVFLPKYKCYRLAKDLKVGDDLQFFE